MTTVDGVTAPHVIVLFGATGDLAKRKLLPGLYHLFIAALLPEGCRIVGSARRVLTSEQFRGHARQSVAEFGTAKPSGEAWRAFARTLSALGVVWAPQTLSRSDVSPCCGSGRAEPPIGRAFDAGSSGGNRRV
jgi:hypothetical protein